MITRISRLALLCLFIVSLFPARAEETVLLPQISQATTTAATPSSAQPSTPPPVQTITVGIGPATLLLSLIVIIIVTTTVYRWRLRIVGLLRGNDAFKVAFYTADTVLLVILGWLVAAADLTKGATWVAPPPQFVVIVPFGIAVFLAATSVKVLLAWSKDREKTEIRQLNETLDLKAAEIQEMRMERNRSIRFATQVRKLIDRKLDGIRALVKEDTISLDQYLNAWDRDLQVHTILKSIHEFFHNELTVRRPDGVLRLALYIPNKEMTQLELLKSWDGEHENCVSQHPERMKLVSGGGLKSIVAETFHLAGDHQLTVVSDCAGDSTFAFFTDEQKNKLRSLIAFKYQLPLYGTESALVLSLDSDEPNFFQTTKAAEITDFLVEMMRRFEYELLNLELTNKLQSKKT